MTIKKNFKGYSVAIGLLLILFVHMGSGGTTSVFMPSIVGENGWELSQFSVVFTWAGISGALIALFLTPTVIKKLSARWSLMLASVLLGIHYVWYGSATTLLSAYLCAAFGGFGVAFGTTAAASVIIANWFVKNRAAVLGVIFAAASFGTATFQFVGGYMLEMFGYRTSWKLLGGFIVVFCGILNLLLVKTILNPSVSSPCWTTRPTRPRKTRRTRQVPKNPAIPSKKLFACPLFIWRGLRLPSA